MVEGGRALIPMLPSAPNSRLHPPWLLLLQAAYSLKKKSEEGSKQREGERGRKSESPRRIGVGGGGGGGL